MLLDIRRRERESEIVKGEETVTHSLNPTQPRRSESLNGLCQGTQGSLPQGSHALFVLPLPAATVSCIPPVLQPFAGPSPFSHSPGSGCMPALLNCGNDILAHPPASILIHFRSILHMEPECLLKCSCYPVLALLKILRFSWAHEEEQHVMFSQKRACLPLGL